MAVQFWGFPEYFIECDYCGWLKFYSRQDAIANKVENERSAAKCSGMKLLKGGRVICPNCQKNVIIAKNTKRFYKTPRALKKEREKFDVKRKEFFQICPELRGEKNIVFTLQEKSMDIDFGSIHLNVAYDDGFPENTRKLFGLDLTHPDPTHIDSINLDVVENGDPEYDTIPEHELIQQHASAFGASLETEYLYLAHKLRQFKWGMLSLYDISDRRVNSIVRRRLGVPTRTVKSRQYRAMNDPIATIGWNEKLKSCKELYTVKFYRVDKTPQKYFPAEEYEYVDDEKAAKAHFERFLNDISLLYSHIELSIVSQNTPERVLRRFDFPKQNEDIPESFESYLRTNGWVK